MALKLMYITNKPEIALIAEQSGVDRIFIDMEYIGKAERQGGMDTVQNHHTVEDVRKIKNTVKKAEVLCRVNPIHDETEEYCSSASEIDGAIEAGADIIMLPFFKTVHEVKTFIELVNKRARTMLLVETPEAVDNIDEILELDGIDEIHIGLNDLSLGYGKKFMFELLADGTVEKLCFKFRQKAKFFGFGGIANLGQGLLPAEKIIKEHYRLGSQCVILSRSFCNTDIYSDLNSIRKTFTEGVLKIRKFEKICEVHSAFFSENLNDIKTIISEIMRK